MQSSSATTSNPAINCQSSLIWISRSWFAPSTWVSKRECRPETPSLGKPTTTTTSTRPRAPTSSARPTRNYTSNPTPSSHPFPNTHSPSRWRRRTKTSPITWQPTPIDSAVGQKASINKVMEACTSITSPVRISEATYRSTSMWINTCTSPKTT